MDNLEALSSKKTLTGVKDVDLIILSELDDKSLLDFCKNFQTKNKYINHICSDENFWKYRFINKYGNVEKESDITWKMFFLKVVYYDDSFKNKDLITTRKEILKEKPYIINFFSNYLGKKAFEKLYANLDKIQDFDIYTSIKGSPVTWDSSYHVFGDFFRSYPDFPGKPKISNPITREEFSNFNYALEKYLGVKFGNDIINVKKIGDKYELFSQSSMEDDEELILGEKSLINIFRKILRYYRIDIINSSSCGIDFDLRKYLSPEKV